MHEREGVPHLRIRGKGGKSRHLPAAPVVLRLITRVPRGGRACRRQGRGAVPARQEQPDGSPREAPAPRVHLPERRQALRQAGRHRDQRGRGALPPRHRRHQRPAQRRRHRQGADLARTRQHQHHPHLRPAQRPARRQPYLQGQLPMTLTSCRFTVRVPARALLVVSAMLLAASATAQVKLADGWIYSQHIDPITDQNTSFVFKQSDEAFSAVASGWAVLALRCNPTTANGLSLLVFLSAGHRFGKLGATREVTVRFDHDTPTTKAWGIGEDGQPVSLFATPILDPRVISRWAAGADEDPVSAPSSVVDQYIARLQGAQNFVFRSKDQNGATLTYQWDPSRAHERSRIARLPPRSVAPRSWGQRRDVHGTVREGTERSVSAHLGHPPLAA